VDQTTVYWPAQVDGTVVKAGINGGTPTTLVNPSEFTFPAMDMPTRLAIDPTYVYFANQLGDNILRVAIAGSSPVTLGGVQGESWPGKVAIDPADSSVYWVTTTTGALYKAGLSGGTFSTLEAAPSPGNSGEQYELAGVDSNSVYWLAQGSPAASYTDGVILKVGFNGGTPSTVASGLTWLGDATVDSTTVYFSNRVDGTILKVPSSGGTIVTLATGIAGPRRLVVDDANVYWTAGGTDQTLMTCSSTVQKVSLNGGEVVDLVFAQFSSYAVTVDQSSVYWADIYGGTVRSAPK
jgi:hypothetical protein